jgi:hypothetical protein
MTTLSDFRFIKSGYGHYDVTFTSPKTGKTWKNTTSDMPLIDVTKNADDKPLQRDLNKLKSLCKSGRVVV